MITYNNRYRGPYEYDKFMFNILSLHNVLESLETMEVRGTNEEIVTLKGIYSDVNDIYTIFTGLNGVSEKAFITMIRERECMNR